MTENLPVLQFMLHLDSKRAHYCVYVRPKRHTETAPAGVGAPAET